MSTPQRPSVQPWLWLTIFLFHFAFFLSGYVQEDAFITFRTGFNLADHGVYSYNTDENYPGATSLLYGHYTAWVRMASGGFAVNAIGLLNLLYSCVAGWLLCEVLLATSLLRLTRHNVQHHALLFVACTAPALLRASGSGMETPLLILVMAAALWAIQHQRMLAAAVCLAMLPFVRIDAVSFALICVGVVMLTRPKAGLMLLAGLALGVVALLEANHATFGAYLPLTAEAKQLAYAPRHDVASVAANVWKVFVQGSYVPGVASKFIPLPLYGLITAVYLGAMVWLGRAALARTPEGERGLVRNASFLILAAASLLVPLAYAYGGVVFPWYLWPSSVMAMLVLTAAVLSTRSVWLLRALVGAVVLTNVFNIVIHLSIAAQESGYRAAIGNHLRRIAPPQATVFLEPAGYIPFFAEIKAYDTVGLASGKVLGYRKQAGERWWISLVQQEQPTFVIERSPIHLDGVVDQGRMLSADELAWFRAHYRLDKHFVYKAYLDENRSTLTPILKLGHHADYYIYQKLSEDRVAP